MARQLSLCVRHPHARGYYLERAATPEFPHEWWACRACAAREQPVPNGLGLPRFPHVGGREGEGLVMSNGRVIACPYWVAPS